MPPQLPAAPFGTREVFTYARIRQPKIIDVAARAKASPPLRQILEQPEPDREAWARGLIASGESVRSEADLRFDYFSHLTIDAIPERLPSRAVVRSPEAFAGARVAGDRLYLADRDRVLASLLAFKTVGDEAGARAAARLLSFIDAFPQLHLADGERDYPLPVFTRASATISAPALTESPAGGARVSDPAAAGEVARLAHNLTTLWTLRNSLIKARRAEFDRMQEEASTPRREATEPIVAQAQQAAGRGRRASGRAPAPPAPKARETRARALAALKTEYRAAVASTTLDAMMAMDPAVLPATGAPAAGLAALQDETRTLLARHEVPAGGFLETYERVAAKADAMGAPLASVAGDACYREHPRVVFHDTVRLLGHADLIRVDETFVEYTAGEISFVENILAGEVRKREVKSTKYFEQASETVTEDATDVARETSVTTKQDLGSQISTALNARMNSEITGSATGSGGGTIGVVDFEGAASAGASVGVGLDTSLSTENTSNFSQELISKALEKTRAAAIEKRLTRSTSLYETLSSLTIDNTGGPARNGIYAFLDRHVCLTEVVYGKRLFIMANLLRPGRNLVCEREQRLALGLSEIGNRPRFEISVDEIQPGTYKKFVAQFKASNVSPPPPPVQTLSRTYKTDNTNTNPEKQGFDLTKAAAVLTPFFEQYKRHLITDSIRLPEGYSVRDVTVTVNHGRNGISVPAHLPLKFLGGALGSGFTLAGAAAASGIAGMYAIALMGPLAMYQFEYAISPLMHYNTDSSNVSVCIGNDTQESPYFFFDPDFLMDQLLNMFGSLAAQAPELLTRIQGLAETLSQDLKTAAAKVPVDVAAAVQASIDDVLNNVRKVFENLSVGVTSKGRPYLKGFDGLASSFVDVTTLTQDMNVLFDPIKTFIDAVVGIFRDGLANALTEMFSVLGPLSANSDVLPFVDAAGMRGELPVSINAVTINPGITINLVASLARSEEGLDRWRLETFDALYQAYLQQLAEYESKALMLNQAERVTKSPEALRREEATAVKELILHALNNAKRPAGQDANQEYSFERINFFENAIDWKNMSYRVFTYGPGPDDVAMEKRGVFGGGDDRRRSFLKGAWAQVLVPVQDSLPIEQKIGQFFTNGSLDFEKGLLPDELSALYQELITERGALAGPPDRKVIGHAVLPTDFIVVQESLPVNTRHACPPGA